MYFSCQTNPVELTPPAPRFSISFVNYRFPPFVLRVPSFLPVPSSHQLIWWLIANYRHQRYHQDSDWRQIAHDETPEPIGTAIPHPKFIAGRLFLHGPPYEDRHEERAGQDEVVHYEEIDDSEDGGIF